MRNSRIFVISDLHAPYHHQDAFAFFRAVKKKYRPTRIINIGDEVDQHGLNFHGQDPNLLSAGDEILLARKYMKELEGIFPKMDLLDSNHGSLHYRKAKHHGIPKCAMLPYNDLLAVGKGWVWHDELMLKIGTQDIYFKHQFNANILRAAETMGCCCVQGHYHSKSEILYTSSPTNLNWGATIGCMIDDRSLAFEYNKLQTKRPILSNLLIEDGFPKLLPMFLKNNHRWNGKVT